MLLLNFFPFPELTTERLLLRRMTSADGEAIFLLRSNESVMEYIAKERVTTINEAEAFIDQINNDIDANEVVMWAISLKEEPARLIGTICYWHFQKEHYRAEIGYALQTDFWRQGIMKEAILKVLDYGFNNLKLHSVEAHIDPGNKGSAAILESTGFVREAYFKENFFFRGQFLDTAIYSKLQNK